MNFYYEPKNMRQLYGTLSVLLIVLVGCWWLLLYKPLNKRYVLAMIDVQLLNVKAGIAKSAADHLPALEKEYEELKKQCNSMVDQLQLSDGQAPARTILHCAEKSRLKLTSYQMKPDGNAITARYVLKGSYEALLSFFGCLHASGADRFISSCLLSLEPSLEICCELAYVCSPLQRL